MIAKMADTDNAQNSLFLIIQAQTDKLLNHGTRVHLCTTQIMEKSSSCILSFVSVWTAIFHKFKECLCELFQSQIMRAWKQNTSVLLLNTQLLPDCWHHITCHVLPEFILRC